MDRSFLTHQPCAPPCWYGLEPDKSSEADVIKTLKTLPFVQPDAIAVYDLGQGAPLIPGERGVSFNCAVPQGQTCGGIRLSDNRVTEIQLVVQYPLTIGTAVKNLGPPEFVTYGPMNVERPGCRMNFAWPKTGIVVFRLDPFNSLACDRLREGKGLDEDLKVGGLQYYSANAFQLRFAISGDSRTSWPGFAPR